MLSFNEIINKDKPVLVDFYASWCGPCKAMTPILKALKTRIGDKANIIKIDVDKNQAVANKYQVQSIPTLILFRNGQEKWRQLGIVSEKVLERVIDNHKE